MPNVFVSYAHHDWHWRDRIKTSLEAMLNTLGPRFAKYKVWTDVRIGAGDAWSPELVAAIDDSAAAVLLLSDYFLASQFIMTEEVPRLFELREKRGLQIVPVVMSACQWLSHASIASLQVRPWSGKPLDAMAESEVNHHLAELMREIGERLQSSNRELGPCPYKGLVPFQQADSEVFFGREAVTAHLVADLEASAVLPVVGSSGSGKSSLINAGVIPDLLKKRWSVVKCKPFLRPLESLAQAVVRWLDEVPGGAAGGRINEAELLGKFQRDPAALERVLKQSATHRAGPHVLVFVDQFEEIFTLASADDRKAFLTVLLGPSASDDFWQREHVHVVFTLRYDFLETADRDGTLGPVLERSKLQPLREMTEGELRDAIEQPAERWGASFEKGLIDRIIHDIGDNRGRLPLLEFCLMQLWEKQRELGGATLTRAAYEAIGEFKGAVAGQAEGVYASLDDEEKAIARAVFMELINVSPDERHGDTRRPATDQQLFQVHKIAGAGDLAARAKAKGVLDQLVEKRLLVPTPGEQPGTVVYEVSHEILLRAWDRLRGWIDSNRNFLRKRAELDSRRRSDDRLHDPLLEEAEGWLNNRRDDLYESEIHYIEESLRTDAKEQVKQLIRLPIEEVYDECKNLRHRAAVEKELRRQLGGAPPDEVARRLRIGLLMNGDRDQVQPLVGWMLKVAPDEFLVIRRALETHKAELVPGLWEVSLDPKAAQPAQVRATSALALYDPDGPHWEAILPRMASRLVSENPLLVSQWIKALHPVRDKLVEPLLFVFNDPQRTEVERDMASGLLVSFAGHRPELLAELTARAEPRQFSPLYHAVHDDPARAITSLEQELARLESDTAIASDDRDRRYALAVLKLARFGQTDRLWPPLADRARPGRRSYLVHTMEPIGIPPLYLADHLATEADPHARRALILALGEYSPELVPEGPRQELALQLLTEYADAPDPGLHAAAAWLLGRWGLAAERDALRLAQAGLAPRPGQAWHVSTQGQTFVHVSPEAPFWMGSLEDEEDRDVDENRHLRQIGRSFALADTPVTNRQFREFERAHPAFRVRVNERYSKGDDCPVINVRWYTAAAYCRWLSEVEGVTEDQMCYPRIETIEAAFQGILPGGEGIDLEIPPGYLSRTGYRLPTEAEWEYACRAGSETARFFGTGVRLLAAYGWYTANSSDRTRPVGLLKPNDLGLFDMLGNVFEWCHDPWSRTYDEGTAGLAVDDTEAPSLVAPGPFRVLRGGAFASGTVFLRSARRWAHEPGFEYDTIGFRVARTLP